LSWLNDVLNEAVALQQLHQMHGMSIVVHVNVYVEVTAVHHCTYRRQIVKECHRQCLTAESVHAK